jgi:hypothetical protein
MALSRLARNCQSPAIAAAYIANGRSTRNKDLFCDHYVVAGPSFAERLDYQILWSLLKKVHRKRVASLIVTRLTGVERSYTRTFRYSRTR